MSSAGTGLPSSLPSTHGADTAILERQRPRLLSLAYSKVADRADAEDVVQDTMEQAVRSWTMIRDLEKSSAWLSTICVRKAMRRLRVRRATQGFVRCRPAKPGYSMQTSDLDLALGPVPKSTLPVSKAVVS